MSADVPLPVCLSALTAACVDAAGNVLDRSPPTLLLPGSFNPLHEGHRTLARVASDLTGEPVAFELSVVNVDKPPLTEAEVRRRLAQFAGVAPVWLTRAPTFREKARLFPEAVFVVGADTAARVVAPRYYPHDAALAECLREIHARRCRFLVAGRTDAQGRFVRLEDLAIPPEHRALFHAVPAERFRVDVSSTQLRRRG